MKPNPWNVARPLRLMILPAALALLATHAPAATRTFTNKAGKTLEATFEGMAGSKALLRLANGKTFEIDPATLSEKDQEFIRKTVAAAENIAARLNKAAGHKFSNGSSFSERKAEDLAKDLRLRPESNTKFGRSWRLYAAFAKNYQLFGAMPYSVALYSDAGGSINNLSIVYANKGDFGSTAGRGENHFNGGVNSSPESLEDAMKRDEHAVAASLSSVLGDATEQRFGDTGTRSTVRRWDWNGHAFLLSRIPGEYVSLSIVSTEYADAGGRSSRVKDSEIKQRLKECVVRKDNGDVFLTEIPMVDQGPKGYCAPATFERAMRAMGLEADMYLLAMVGQSKAGGGTSVQRLLDGVRSAVYRKGRRTRDDSHKQLKIRDVKRYIDQGIPVMWMMCSVEEYNQIANANTAVRSQVQDWNQHAQDVAELAESVSKSPKPNENFHICLIIGYNELTGELAVSDSWGPRYELRWVPVDVASWASMGNTFMILP